MTRYRAIWGRDGQLKAEIENDEVLFWRHEEPWKESELPRPTVIRDIEPYRSMIDGSMISSRAQHREHLRAHDCVEIGNEDPAKHIKKPPMKNTRREVLHKRLADVSDREANKLLKDLKKGLQP
jgi:hypothetical protein